MWTPLFRGPDWKPITPKSGFFLHAYSHARFDSLSDTGGLVRRKIVEHHDVVALEGRGAPTVAGQSAGRTDRRTAAVCVRQMRQHPPAQAR